MRRIHFLFVTILLLTSVLYAVPITILPVHSTSPGVVCVAKDGSTSCPITPALINSTVTSSPPQLRVAIVVNASAGLNSFDITLLTDHTILKPASIDLTGTVLIGQPVLVVECIGIMPLKGTCAQTDTVNTIQLEASSAFGSPLTPFSTTGLLFTAIYNITGTTSNTPIGFQTGCSGTSVPGFCVTVAAGSAASLQETSQPTKFSNRPYFDILPSAAALTVFEGSTDSSLGLTIMSVNRFNGTVTTVVTVSPAGPSASLSPTSVKVNVTNPTDFNTAVTVTVGATVKQGIYNLTFTAMSGSLPANIVTIPLTVPMPDFTITASPSVLRINVSSTSSSIITLSSYANFAGIVNLTLTTSPGLNASLLKSQLNVTKGGSISTTLKVSASMGGSLNVNINGTSGSKIHPTVVRVVVQDFTMTVDPGPVILPQGSSKTNVLSLSSVGTIPFNVTVDVSRTYVNQITSTGLFGPATGVSIVCSPAKANVTNNGNNEVTKLVSCLVTAIQIGNYTMTIFGVAGVLGSAVSITHAVTFPVQVLGPDFTLVPSATVEPVSLGSSTSLNITLTGSLGLKSNVTLSFPTPPAGVSLTIKPVVLLTPTTPSATVNLTITAGPSATTGTYFVTLTAFATSLKITHTITLTLVVTTTTSPHDLAIYSVSASPTSATIGSNVTITIVVQNLGKAAENSTVIAIAGDVSVAQKNITIAVGQNMTVILTWNTGGFSSGAYIIGGKVLGVQGETILSNNLLRSPTPVTLTASNTNLLQSPYFEPSIIAALIVIVGIVAFLFLRQIRGKAPQPVSQ